jgi:hypothetical protein
LSTVLIRWLSIDDCLRPLLSPSSSPFSPPRFHCCLKCIQYSSPSSHSKFQVPLLLFPSPRNRKFYSLSLSSAFSSFFFPCTQLLSHARKPPVSTFLGFSFLLFNTTSFTINFYRLLNPTYSIITLIITSSCTPSVSILIALIQRHLRLSNSRFSVSWGSG